jgi:hypothetical protein
MANMGGKHEPPKTVLVPPMFERDLKARSRMAKSSYDYLFSKPSLRWLFGDYMGLGLNTVLRECIALVCVCALCAHWGFVCV